jgi:hypothetical protein
MAEPKAHLYELSRVERAAFNSFMNSNHDDPKVAQRKLRKAQAEHVTHTGGATPQELRDVYDYTHPNGPTCRAHAPDRWAILWGLFESYEGDLRTACAKGNDAIGVAEQARLDAIGADRGYRDMLVQMFSQDSWEIMDNIVAGRLFNRELFSKLYCAALPGIMAKAESARDVAYIARMLKSAPDWVWQSWLPDPVERGLQPALMERGSTDPPLLSDASALPTDATPLLTDAGLTEPSNTPTTPPALTSQPVTVPVAQASAPAIHRCVAGREVANASAKRGVRNVSGSAKSATSKPPHRRLARRR